MLKLLLSLLCGFALSANIEKPFYDINLAKHYFNDFVTTYNKNYESDDEKFERLKIFTDNLIEINKMNAMDTAIHGVNQFSDLTRKEFLATRTGFIPSPKGSSCIAIRESDVSTNDAPDSFDWRDQQMVTPVKDQGSCGSCYAFSAVGNIESKYAIKNNGEHLDLSEQEAVSCSAKNSACQGGVMAWTMEDVMDLGGIELESDYPYLNTNDDLNHPCTFKKELVKVQLSGCVNFQFQDEEKLKQALYKTGPISVAVAANALMTYHGGIIDSCPGDIDHAVLLVGYGIDNTQGPFWILKNSWASSFGEQGYFRITRGKNTCQIMNQFIASAVIG